MYGNAHIHKSWLTETTNLAGYNFSWKPRKTVHWNKAQKGYKTEVHASTNSKTKTIITFSFTDIQVLILRLKSLHT